MNGDTFKRDIDQQSAIAPQIRNFLWERIVRNDLPPGSKLSEVETAKAYDVSRQPVREAFIRLASEGLLLTRPQRSTLVTKIDYPSVLQARFVREAVESDIVALLAIEANPALISELREQLKTQVEIVKNFSSEFIIADEKFHRTLAVAADKEVAWQFIEQLKSQMDRVRFLSLEQFPVQKLVAQHTEIVDLIEAGAPEPASLSMRRHLKEILSDLPKIIAEHQEFFERYDNVAIVNPTVTNGVT